MVQWYTDPPESVNADSGLSFSYGWGRRCKHELTPQKILVTGNMGFIAGNLVKYLLDKYPHYSILGIDAQLTGYDINTIKGLDTGRFFQILGNICNQPLIDSILSGKSKYGKISGVLHLAAESHVDRSIEDPLAFVKSNVLGTSVLLRAAYEHNIANFLYCSTDETTGSASFEQVEGFKEDQILNPSSPYSASKAAGELMTQSFFHTYELPVKITRCTNNYGPFQNKEKLIPKIIYQALRGESIPIYGDGKQLRDWLYVEDHCKALDLVFHRGTPGGVYNIAGGNERTNLQVTEDILKILDKPLSLITYVKDRPAHDLRYFINSDKITKELGWQPGVSWYDGLSKTINWYLEKYKCLIK